MAKNKLPTYFATYEKFEEIYEFVRKKTDTMPEKWRIGRGG